MSTTTKGTAGYDRRRELQAFDDTKAGVKGLVDAERFSEALETYRAMVDDGSVAADGFTCPPVIKACAALGAVDQGRMIREHVEASVACGDTMPNVFVQCALVDMFAKCGCLGEARSVFESMQERHVAAWTAMIGGKACGSVDRACRRLARCDEFVRQDVIGRILG